MSKVTLKLEGLSKIITNLNGNVLYASPMRHVMESIVEIVASKAETRAPKRTYRLAGSVQSQVDSRPLPSWGKITAEATSSQGFRYPFALEAGHRSPRGQGTVKMKRRGPMQSGMIPLRYRGTKRSTRKWFSGSMRGMKKRAGQLLNWAAREVERNWQR